MTAYAGENLVRVLTPETENDFPLLDLDAGATLQAVYEAADSPDLLRHTLSGWFTPQWRATITVGQAVLSPNLAPQWIAALLALDTQAAFDAEDQTSSLADFLKRAKAHRGRLASLRVPLNVPGRAWGEAHVARTPADQPILSAIAVLELADSVVQQARLALTGVWREYARLAESAGSLVNAQLEDERIEAVASAVEQEVQPSSDFLGSAGYRRAMAGVLTRRALQACRDGANGHD